MAERLIATLDGDELFFVGYRVEANHVDGRVPFGYIKTVNGDRISVPNIDLLTQKGFWIETVW